MPFLTLPSKYQLYKQDTDSVATWLASTANYIIEIKDFVPLAKYIAAESHAVPVTFEHTIERVIKTRAQFSYQLEQHGKALDETANANHRYFIQVLEKVRDILLPLVPESKYTEKKPSNQFAALTVSGSSEESEDAPDIEWPQKAQNDKATYEAEAGGFMEHSTFALAIVIEEANDLRAQIVDVWSRYRDAHFDPVGAAMATNTATDLIRNSVQGIIPFLDRNGGLPSIIRKLYQVRCEAEGHALNHIIAKSKEGQLTYETYNVAVNTYFNAFQLVENFLDIMKSNRPPIDQDGKYKRQNVSSDRSSKSEREKLADDRALLMPFSAEVLIVNRVIGNWPLKDEFMRGMEEMDRTKQVPFYLVFAAQAFLDVTYALGGEIGRPFESMIKLNQFIDDDIKAHFEFHENLKIPTWSANNEQQLKHLQHDVKLIVKDPTRIAWKVIYAQAGATAPDMPGHQIFRMSPVLSGLFLFRFRSRYHEISKLLVNVRGSVQYCGHLYNATKQEKLLPITFFVGGETPKTPKEYERRFILQLGMSAAALPGTKGRRKNASLKSKSGPRGLQNVSRVSDMFRARYVENTGQGGITPEDVDKIISLSLFEEVGCTEDGELRMRRIQDAEKLRDKKSLQNPKKREKVKECNVSMEQLIESLAIVLQTESIEHSFPFLTMHRICWRLLRAVKKSCDPFLTEQTQIDECELPSFVGLIFQSASDPELGASGYLLLVKAAEAMNEFFAPGEANFIIREAWENKLGRPNFRIDYGNKNDGDESNSDKRDGNKNDGDSNDGSRSNRYESELFESTS
ncbi:hypothetical protein F5Y16DRAFT_422173 [Xylariaceae sp. FL0255]|nr:hypothetical protein F5Y16DRAFT_422173 [Xylariaceae sp. FL0255]